jgi:hypothetical protein
VNSPVIEMPSVIVDNGTLSGTVKEEDDVGCGAMREQRSTPASNISNIQKR